MLTIKRVLFIITLTSIVGESALAQPSDTLLNFTKYVNPFIGTDGTGHTYPGASVPFGMVQVSPDTRTSGWENCSGYHSSNPTIIGFSHTHLNGTGAADYGDILVTPTVGKIQFEPGDENNPGSGYRSAFNHSTEKASPGYYCVVLSDENILAEVTSSAHAAMHRYTFSKTDSANIIIDLNHGIEDQTMDASVKVISETEVSGYRRSKGWAKNQFVYFNLRFSKPFRFRYLTSDNDENIAEKESSGKNVKACFTFSMADQESLLIKVGISAVDENGASGNLQTEIPGWDFDKIKVSAEKEWNKELGKIKTEGGSANDKVNFYTAMYHALLSPNIFSDCDGRYRGMDNQVHHSDRAVYSVFSLWDTFRAEHPLFTILDTLRAQDMVNSLLVKYDEFGLLPVWELASNETYCMIGYHSVPVIFDAYAKGLRNFDVEKAFTAMKKSSMENKLGLKNFKELGYIPSDRENEAVSKSLEYSYDDWCISQMAKSLGKFDDYLDYLKRSKCYINNYDVSTGFMRAKKTGNWVEPFDPFEVSGTYTEANAWQYSYFVPHDIDGLKKLHGGDKKFSEKIDALFSAKQEITGRDQPDISGMIGQYAHGNEPSHHMAYLYNYTGEPWKSQSRVREIMNKYYKNSRDGLCGNDDCGQMSAWYIFSAIGFYPVCPGSNEYAIGSPLFTNVTITVGDGKTFSVKANNNKSTNCFIQSARLNGKPYDKSYLRHSDIMSGGELVLEMGSVPNKTWAAGEEQRPHSRVDYPLVMNPFFVADGKAFIDSTKIKLQCYTEGAKIYYTLDGTEPTSSSALYTKPITLHQTTVIKAVAVKEGMQNSFVQSQDFIWIPFKVKTTYKYPYSHLYTAGGSNGLFDRVYGETDSWGAWQGFEGNDFDAVIDLGEKHFIGKISSSYLQSFPAWIWLPKNVEYSVSDDGKNFVSIGVITNDEPLNKEGGFTKKFELKIEPQFIRYIHIVAKNIGTCPSWHPGAGGKSWVFVDEVDIE